MAQGAAALFYEGATNTQFETMFVEVQLGQEGWTEVDSTYSQNDLSYSRGNNYVDADISADYTNDSGSNQEVTKARVWLGDQEPSEIIFPEADISGSPITLEPGQILRFTQIRCTFNY